MKNTIKPALLGRLLWQPKPFSSQVSVGLHHSVPFFFICPASSLWFPDCSLSKYKDHHFPKSANILYVTAVGQEPLIDA